MKICNIENRQTDPHTENSIAEATLIPLDRRVERANTSANIIIAGDFNMNDLIWSDINSGIMNGNILNQVNLLMKFMKHFFFNKL